MSKTTKADGRELEPEALYRVTVNRVVPVPASALPRFFRPGSDNLLKGKLVAELPAAAIVKVEAVETTQED